jgi:hypothetical protein|tara:strand:+ start:1317 stop:3350 length:2034 start_codon:yes stop_codon:yes gene_type:complete
MMKKDPRANQNEELYRQWRDARSDWDTEARKDIDFYLGNHFTQDESDELSSRNQADIPMDRVSAAIEKFKAVLTSRPPAFTITPREDSDVQVATLWRTIMGYVWQKSDGDWQMKQAIQDYATTGMGYLYAYVDAESDFGRGDVKFTYVDPFRIYASPSSRDRWFGDSDGLILSTILTGEQAIGLYPELADKIDPITGEEIPGIIREISGYSHDEEDYPSSQNKNSMSIFTPAEVKDKDYYKVNKYKVLERFYKVKVPFYRVIDMKTQEESILSQEEYVSFIENNSEAVEIGAFTVIEIFQTRVKVCASMGEIVLYEQILNTDEYPVVPLPNIWTGTPYPKSDVSRARPMQRLLNKLWSLALSHAQASAGLKLLVPLGSVEDLDQLEKDWANPNAVIEVDSSQGEPHYPAPQPLAGEFYRLIQQSEFYIDFIFGLPEMMHGFAEKAPETMRATERMIALGSERPKSKLRDIEFSINKLGKVLYNLSKGHYTYKKIFRLAQPNNNITEVMANFYTDVSNAVLDLKKDKHILDQHDIRIESGSTMPSSKYAELAVYLEAFQMGIVDRYEVLKKNPELFDKEGIMRRTEEKQLMQQQIQGMEEQIKNLQGDLQTAQRESVSDRKRVEVEKFKSRLAEVNSESKADRRVQRGKLENEVKLEVEKLSNNLKEVQRKVSSTPEA